MILSRVKRAIRNRVFGDRRSWIDEQLILSAKTLMATPGWSGPIEHSLSEKEFKVYSQFGDDGIIQYLIRHVPIAEPTFIEFGVGDYFESNTHFLLVNNNWRGLVLDGSPQNIETIRNSPIYWRHDLTATCAFIDRDNIGSLLAASGFGRVGVLHIDLDGNDYWICERIDFEKLKTDILILEYNAVFGAEREISIPYDATFDRFKAHPSCLYWGASLPAFAALADQRGFFFVGTNAAGNNAYFVNKEHAGSVPAVDLATGFLDSRFRESRDDDFKLSYVSGSRRQELIRGLKVCNTRTNVLEEL